MRAKVIKGKTYLFKPDGVMVDGVVYISGDIDKVTGNGGTYATKMLKDEKGGAISKDMVEGWYYFNNGARSVKGQMLTGKQAYTTDGETYYYYFDKSTGAALTNQVKDGVVYGDNGRRIQADDGNANMIYELANDEWILYKGKWIEPGSSIIVSSTGKLRTGGTVRVDGVKYVISQGAENTYSDGSKGNLWSAEEPTEE